LVLASGDRVPVPHPDFISHPPGARTAVVMGADESVRIIDTALVEAIELTPPVSAGSITQPPNGGE
jgi:hypothetical protein